MRSYFSMLVVSSLVCSACLPSARADEAAVDKQKIRQLIEQLDDDKFARRAAATKQLMALGLDAFPQLRKVAVSGSAEARSRAKQIIYFMVTVKIRAGFAKLGQVKKDEDVDVEQGMWLISRIVDPLVKKKELDRQLDALADRVRKRIAAEHGQETEPKTLPPADAVAAVRHVLFTEERFTGNVDDYDNPVNSSLSHVLKTRLGLPILLSHVVVSVAQRLEIPIVGVGISGRYMCMYDGSRAPGGAAENIIIDPFGGGRLLTRQQLKEVVPGLDPRRRLSPDDNGNAVMRMLRNLESDFYAVGDDRMAKQVAEHWGQLSRQRDAR